jgi:hypothetical protein
MRCGPVSVFPIPAARACATASGIDRIGGAPRGARGCASRLFIRTVGARLDMAAPRVPVRGRRCFPRVFPVGLRPGARPSRPASGRFFGVSA